MLYAAGCKLKSIDSSFQVAGWRLNVEGRSLKIEGCSLKVEVGAWLSLETKQKKIKTNIIDIDKWLCLKVYRKVKTFDPALMGLPYAGRRLFLPQQKIYI